MNLGFALLTLHRAETDAVGEGVGTIVLREFAVPKLRDGVGTVPRSREFVTLRSKEDAGRLRPLEFEMAKLIAGDGIVRSREFAMSGAKEGAGRLRPLELELLRSNEGVRSVTVASGIRPA